MYLFHRGLYGSTPHKLKFTHFARYFITRKSVTRAAEKTFMTQSGMSNNLQQLREIFKDELLMREKMEWC